MAVEIPKSGWLAGGAGLQKRGHKIAGATVTIEAVFVSVTVDIDNLFQIVQQIAAQLDGDAGVSETTYLANIGAIATGPETTVEP